jgi:DNA-directed RNA polymerase subunit RPC12/RpoP
MTSKEMEAHLAPPVTIDYCTPCQSFWFDKYEDLHLSPGSTLELMKFIGEHAPENKTTVSAALHCPRCGGTLLMTHDMQRSTRFSYWRCEEHGRFLGFFEFLKEKNFIQTLPAQQVQELRDKLQTANCSNCGAAIDLTKDTVCSHCGSPISIVDMSHSQEVIKQLQQLAEPKHIDPSLPLELEAVKRNIEHLFGPANVEKDS